MSFVNASTKRIRWSHRSEHISRPCGLFLLRGNSTSATQAGTSERSTVVGEPKLQQPHGFTKTEQSDLPLLATAEPDQSTKSLTADEKQVVFEMRKEDYSRLRIAQFLGCDLRVVHDALYQLGPIDSRRSKLPRFRLSDSELKRAEALRREGMTWKAIQLQEFPDIGLSTLREKFTLQMTALGKPVPVIIPPKLTLYSTDLQEIAELLRAGKSWLQIAKLKLKLCETARYPARQLRRA